jgi:DNA-binding NarL/FixJ family response regulator
VEKKKLTIAIVDDSEIIRQRLVQRLNKCECFNIIWQSENVENTYCCFNQSAPSALILDIQLPDGSGIDILEKIKLESPFTKIIMLTNYPSLPFKNKCVKAGADYFFDKSTEFEKVFEILKELALSESIKN